ncbi:putative colanic acid biosynthesis acetyltransferase [Cerasicoccus fimbriatus]|uniref:putative colanic acid biosynthesis acetyltransferase n=1 Tax=Cerasicoccus fimbriatus TaxID=3014554 RepID=UPI0022B318E9|nr:putative colanic acid biosynthesis acetyltransferase [Cerasicoccus sp. TK19100]
MTQLNIKANRKAVKYSKRILAARLCWGLCRCFFRCSPRVAYGFRNSLLRLFGAKVGQDVRIHPTAVIQFPWNLAIGDYSSIGDSAYIYNLGFINIGRRSTVSQFAHLCAGTHDFTDPTMPLLCPPISVGDDAWLCAETFIGPSVIIGNGAVVGARSVVVKDVPPWKVVIGNPARIIKDRNLFSE